MLSSYTSGGTVRAAENDRNVDRTGRHVECFGRRVDDLIDGLHGEVEGHELAHRTQTGEGSADGNTGETHLGDGRIDYPLVAVLFPQTSGHLLKECVKKLYVENLVK